MFEGTSGDASPLINTAMALTEPATPEDQAWQDMEIAVSQCPVFRGTNSGIEGPTLLDWPDAIRRPPTAARAIHVPALGFTLTETVRSLA